jgi:2,3-bisphosphoglycerate-dependent phosphoglycerate mutase
MRTLYVVTHPESTHHVDRLVGGWFDSALTPEGHEQARRISMALAARVPAGASVELYASDLLRTRETAEHLAAEFGVPIVLDAALREKAYGEAEGRSQSWLDQRFIPPPASGDRMNHFEGLSGSETRGDLAARVYPALERILSSDAAHQIVVTHGFAAVLLMAAWIKMPMAAAGHVSFGVSSGGISVLTEDDFFHNRQLATLNDVAHLA